MIHPLNDASNTHFFVPGSKARKETVGVTAPPPGVSTVEFTVAAKHDARICDKPANIVLAHGRSYDFLLFFATCDL